MRKATTYLLALICTTFIIYSCSKSSEKTGEEPAAMTPEEVIKHGEYLVTVGGCNDCHTPKIMTEKGPAMDMSRMLSGHPADAMLAPYDSTMIGPWVLLYNQLTAAVGPWGTSYAANLTPHETGIANLTEENFLKIFATGKHLGLDNGRPVMPPMPWEQVAKFKIEDQKAIFAYLKSIPPIDNKVPAYMPPGAH